METRIARSFVLVKALESLASAWFFSTYILFLTGKGLTLLEANLLNVIFMTVSTAFDPLTGNLADRIGQKRIYMSGLFFWGAGMMVYGWGQTWLTFAVAEATSAIGHALISEAMESWLRNHCGELATHQALSRSQYWSRIAMIPTALMGGWIGARVGLEWPWFLAGGTSFLVLVLVWLKLRKIPERPDGQVVTNTPKVLEMIKITWRHRNLKMVVGSFALVSACTMPFNMFWPIVFRDASGRSDWLGSLWIGIALAIALGAWLAKKWPTTISGMAGVVLVIGIPMLLPSTMSRLLWPILVFFLVHEIGRGIWLPVLFTYANRHIENEVRSTMNSIRSASGTLGGAIGLLVSGLLTKLLTPTQVWGVSAIALIALAGWLWSRRKNY